MEVRFKNVSVFILNWFLFWVTIFFVVMTHRYTHNPFLNFQLAIQNYVHCQDGATAFH